VRVIDLITPEPRPPSSDGAVAKNRVITDLYGGQALDFDRCCASVMTAGRCWFRTSRTWTIVQDAHDAGAHPGGRAGRAGSTPACLRHVSVPVRIAGAAIGIGLGPPPSNASWAFKAPDARRNGPMPTEPSARRPSACATRRRRRARQYGATGPLRRCGWFDGVLARYSARLNGMNSVALTCLDVLSQFERWRCVSRTSATASLNTLPAALPAVQ
jgi:adenylosuccinate synthase